MPILNPRAAERGRGHVEEDDEIIGDDAASRVKGRFLTRAEKERPAAERLDDPPPFGDGSGISLQRDGDARE